MKLVSEKFAKARVTKSLKSGQRLDDDISFKNKGRELRFKRQVYPERSSKVKLDIRKTSSFYLPG